ncbi:MAG: YtxH domain-containing protein [Alloprevotella sp.]|nr:YtxH domain-containing protein [Alloprevotella sp.]
MKTFSAIFTFLCGAAVGTACGLLLAPEKGEDTRKKLVEKGKKIADKVNENLKAKGINLSLSDIENIADDIADELEPDDAE